MSKSIVLKRQPKYSSSLSLYDLAFFVSLSFTLIGGILTSYYETQIWSNLRNSLVFWSLFTGCLLFSRRLGREYQNVFSLSLSARLVVVLFMVVFPPVYTRALVEVPAIFPDEVFYTQRALAWSHYPIHTLHPSTQYELVVAYMAVIYRLFGPDVLWIRLVHVLLGALTSVFLYYAASMKLGTRGRRAAFWIAPLLPNLVMWSSVLLKESVFILGVSMLVAAAARIRHGGKQRITIVLAVLGIVIVFSLRAFVVVFASLPLIWVVLFGSGRLKRTSRFLVLGLLLIILPLGIRDLAGRLEYYGGSVDPLNTVNVLLEKTKSVESTSLLNRYVAQRSLLVQIAVSPILLLTSPPHTAMTSFLTKIGDIWFWPGWKTASLAAGWWLSLPFVILGTVTSLREKETFWRAVAFAFLIWFIFSSYGRGMTVESVRLREHLAVFPALLVCKGIDSLSGGPFRNVRKWHGRLTLYYGTLVLSAVLYTWKAEILSLLSSLLG